MYWPRVMQTPRDKYLLGGIHMTEAASVVNYLLKELAATETGGHLEPNTLVGLSLADIQHNQDGLYRLQHKQFLTNFTDPIQQVRRKV